MKDKYSKIEEKVEEGKRRAQEIEKCLLAGLALKDGLDEHLLWEIVLVKNDVNGERVNVVEVKTKNSVVKFVLNKEKESIERVFRDGFVNNLGQKESLSLRIG
jgi:hypothetical protein